MKYPQEFYCIETVGKKNLTAVPTGRPDIEAFIHGASRRWVDQCAPERKPKHLIIADWRKWSGAQQVIMAHTINELRRAGFPISLYIYPHYLTHSLVPIHSEINTDYPQGDSFITSQQSPVISSNVLLEIASDMTHLSKQHIHILDDVWVDHCLHGFEGSPQRTLKLYDFSQLTEEKKHQLIEVMQSSTYKPHQIIVDEFPVSLTDLITIHQAFPHTPILFQDYRAVTLTTTEATALIRNGTLMQTDGEHAFTLEQLSSITTLDLSETELDLQHVKYILERCERLERLDLSKCDEISNEFIENLFMDTTTHVPETSLHHLQSLQYINLASNKIRDEDLAISIVRSYCQGAYVETEHSKASYSPAITPDPTDPIHQASNYKEFKPAPPEDVQLEVRPSHFLSHNHTKDQGMIIEKLSHYLRLTQQHTAIIPSLKEGICAALAHLFVHTEPMAWEKWLNNLHAWNGKSETITADLTSNFMALVTAIQRYHLHQESRAIYIGDKLISILTTLGQNTTCVLVNPWHAIAVRRNTSEQWTIYDPNYVNGAKTTTTDNIYQEILVALGSLQAALYSSETFREETVPRKFIDDPLEFINEGGLLMLASCRNADALLQELPLKRSLLNATADGLLLRNLKGKPAWVVGLNNQETAALTCRLLTDFILKNPTSALEVLTHSLEAITAYEKYECITRIIQVFSMLKQNIVTRTILTALKTSNYENQLQTWTKPRAKENTLPAYVQRCFSQYVIGHDQQIKKRLIELTSTQDVNVISLALQQYAKNTHRPIYYINSPEDLICSAPFISHETGHTGVIHPGPGGALYDFIHTHPQGTILINYEHFSPEAIVRFNTILDTERRIDGVLLPPELSIIGLSNIHHPNNYQGADFYSRFDWVERCPIPSEALKAAYPPLPIHAKPNEEETAASTKNTRVINLFHALDWKEQLLGRWELHGEQLIYQEGALAALLNQNTPIEIQNGLWDDEEFNRFWQHAFLYGYITHEGREILIPEGLTLLTSEGYDWADLNRQIQPTLEPTPEEHVLNPSTLYTCFPHYRFNETTHHIEQLPGAIAEATGQSLHLCLTRELSEDDHARLLTACQTHQVALHLRHATQLPPFFEPPPWGHMAPTTLINSSDPDVTVAMLANAIPDLKVIDVSECHAEDLLTCLEGDFDMVTLKFNFRQTTHALIQALNAGESIVLKGHFSTQLSDKLAPLLLARTTSRPPSGRLILVSESTDTLNVAGTAYQHLVTAAEKQHLLETEPPVLRLPTYDEPLSVLRARRNFLRAFPSTTDTSMAWAGLADLPAQTRQLTPLNPDTSAEDAARFMRQRQQEINAMLNHAPYVFLAGLSGVGKSTFVKTKLCTAEDQLYVDKEAMQAWATAPNDGRRKILFLDEANLEHRDWSEFEGLFQTPPHILIQGILYPLSREHKVVFAGNPLSYGDERHLAPLFTRHGSALVFSPLPTANLYEDILKPVFRNTRLAHLSAELSAIFLEIYPFLVECSTTEVLITPRELQMMALMTLAHCETHGIEHAVDVAEHYAYQISAPLVPEAFWDDFNTQFIPPALDVLTPHRIDNEDYIVPPSRYAIQQQLDDLLALRLLRQDPNKTEDAQKYGGLGGIILEGEPGMGKSEMVINTLIHHGFHEVRTKYDVVPPRPFYRIPVSLGPTEKEALLLKAFHEGAVAVIDELNSGPMMERLLNHLLMGSTPDGTPPNKPGFMIICTQNPGRRTLSNALTRRLFTTQVEPYFEEEMQHILMNKGVPDTEATALLLAYQKQRQFAESHALSPAPTFRDVINIAASVSHPKEDSQTQLGFKAAVSTLRGAESPRDRDQPKPT